MKLIATALVKAKKSFRPALKTSENPHFRSKYASLDACLDAVDDALTENGIFMYQETTEDSAGVTVETVFLHESGEILRCGKLHVPASKQDPQGYGSALTYARRYSLMTATGIAGEDDDGTAGSVKQQPASMTDEQRNEIVYLIESRTMAADDRKRIDVWLKKPQTVEAAAKTIKFLKNLEEVGL